MIPIRLISLLAVTFLFNFTVFGTFSSNIPKEITESIKKGDSKALTAFLNENIEMAILNDEGIYSKQQAEQVLKKFFENNPPTDFSIIHIGGKESSRYAIGEYKSNNKNYRITIYLKDYNGKPLIHQLRIQYENTK